MNRILKPETGCAYKTRPSKNLRDMLVKLERYLDTLFSEHNDSIDTFFCEEEREVLFKMLDQVEATLPDQLCRAENRNGEGVQNLFLRV